MARGAAAKRVLQVEIPAEASDDDEHIDQSQEDVDAEAAIQEAGEDAVSNAQAVIYRVDPSTGERYWLDSVEPKLVRNEFLMTQFGGGNYVVVFKKPFKGKGPKRPNAEKRYRIDPQIPPKLPAKYHAPHPNGAPIAGNGSTPGLSQSGSDIIGAGVLQIISSMQEASKTNAALTQAAIDRLNKPGPSLAEIAGIATPIVTAIGGLVTAIITRPVPTPPDAMATAVALANLMKGKDPTETIAALAPLLKPRESDPNSVAGILSAVEKVVAIGQNLHPSEGDTGWAGVARDALRAVPEVAAVMRRNGNGAPPPSTGPVSTVAPVPALPSPGPLPSKPASLDEMLAVALRPIAERLLAMFSQGADPALQAEAFYDEYKSMHGPMRSFTDEPQYQDKLLGMFPGLRAYEPQTRIFMTELAQLLRESP